MDATQTKTTEERFDRALAIAEELDPNAKDTTREKELAAAMVDLRASITGDDGQPDWLGLTHEFRSMAQAIHTSIPGDARAIKRLKGRLRQHYLKLLPEHAEKEELTDALEHAEDQALPLDGDFFDDLGVFVSERGRPSKDAMEAHLLVLVADKLLSMVDTATIDGAAATSLRMTTEQSLAPRVDRLLRALKS